MSAAAANPHLGIHFGELVIVGMAEIQRHEDAARDGGLRD